MKKLLFALLFLSGYAQGQVTYTQFTNSNNFKIIGRNISYIRPAANNCNMLFIITYFGDTANIAGWMDYGRVHCRYVNVAAPAGHFAITLPPRKYFYSIAVDSPYVDNLGITGKLMQGWFIIK